MLKDDIVALLPDLRAFARFMCREREAADDLTAHERDQRLHGGGPRPLLCDERRRDLEGDRPVEDEGEPRGREQARGA